MQLFCCELTSQGEYYAGDVIKHKINIVSDAGGEPIKGEISKFKSFISHTDYVTGRLPRGEVMKVRGGFKFIFGTNHHFRFKGVCDSNKEAFFDRLCYIPFNNVIDYKERDFFLDEKLREEYDYVFTWGMKGLKRFIENDYQFSSCEISEGCKLQAMAQHNPVESFYYLFVEEVDDYYEKSEKIAQVFRKIGEDNNLKNCSRDVLKKYLSEKGFHCKKRHIDDSGNRCSACNSAWSYKGIRLKK